MKYFCTYFDRNYLYKGLTLYRSLARHSPEFVLYILCFDDTTFDILSRLSLPGVELIRRTEFEDGDERLLAVKTSRSRVEYLWTCTPSLPLFLFAHHPEIDLLTYLDSDIYFFADPALVLSELGGNSVLITGHRYSPTLRHLEAKGVYNVQFIAVKRDQAGTECLRWWRERCLEWCYNRLEDGRFGDQKYLDEWPERFAGVHVLGNIGGGVAPWNVEQYNVDVRDGRPFVDGVPIIFYHFHQFRILTGGRFYLASSLYSKTRELPRAIYDPYIEAMKASVAEVRRVDASFKYGVDSNLPVMMEAAARKYLPTGIKNLVKRHL